MLYPIEKDIPIPARLKVRAGGNKFRWGKYPLAKMAVGDSIVIDKPQPSASGLVSDFGRRHGTKFTVRRIDENTTRIWRIS